MNHRIFVLYCVTILSIGLGLLFTLWVILEILRFETAIQPLLKQAQAAQTSHE